MLDNYLGGGESNRIKNVGESRGRSRGSAGNKCSTRGRSGSNSRGSLRSNAVVMDISSSTSKVDRHRIRAGALHAKGHWEEAVAAAEAWLRADPYARDAHAILGGSRQG